MSGRVPTASAPRPLRLRRVVGWLLVALPVFALGIAVGTAWRYAATAATAHASSAPVRVDIENAGAVSPEELRVYAGLARGASGRSLDLRALDPYALRDRILRHPFVAAAEVELDYPSRVTVRVTRERRVAGLLELDGERFAAVDENHEPFYLVEPPRTADEFLASLPPAALVTNPPPRFYGFRWETDWEESTRADTDARLKNLQAFVREYRATNLAQNLPLVRATIRRGRLQAYAGERPTRIEFGVPERATLPERVRNVAYVIDCLRASEEKRVPTALYVDHDAGLPPSVRVAFEPMPEPAGAAAAKQAKAKPKEKPVPRAPCSIHDPARVAAP